MTIATSSHQVGNELHFFDCNTFVGRSFGSRNLGPREAEPAQLLAELDRVGIERAVIYHFLAKDYAPAVGNQQVLEAARKGGGRLFAGWVVLPEHTGELAEPRSLVSSMLSKGVRLARVFPSFAAGAHRFSLAEWCSGSMLEALEERRVPLSIDFTLFRREEPPWRELYDVCSNHPRLPILLIDIQGRNNRTLYPLLRQFDNLYIQTAGFDVHAGLEDMCARFGAQRLVFGSGYPVRSLGSAWLQLERARLTDEEKRLIASGNLDRLLGAVTTSEN